LVRVEKGYDLYLHEGQETDRGRERILYLLVVDENEYDFFDPKGKGSTWTKTDMPVSKDRTAFIFRSNSLSRGFSLTSVTI
jgi:hypothetical protein